ncbi:hypothetical protein KIPB_007718, partial [Kipferlia bialata]|eukprot:g7718.t1
MGRLTDAKRSQKERQASRRSASQSMPEMPTGQDLRIVFPEHYGPWYDIELPSAKPRGMLSSLYIGEMKHTAELAYNNAARDMLGGGIFTRAWLDNIGKSGAFGDKLAALTM